MDVDVKMLRLNQRRAEFRVDPADAAAFDVEIFADDECAAWAAVERLGRAMARAARKERRR